MARGQRHRGMLGGGRGNRIVPCRGCGRNYQTQTSDGSLHYERGADGRPVLTGFCPQCYDYAGWENTHSDYGHEGNPAADYREGCPVCEGKPAPWAAKEPSAQA